MNSSTVELPLIAHKLWSIIKVYEMRLQYKIHVYYIQYIRNAVRQMICNHGLIVIRSCLYRNIICTACLTCEKFICWVLCFTFVRFFFFSRMIQVLITLLTVVVCHITDNPLAQYLQASPLLDCP